MSALLATGPQHLAAGSLEGYIAWANQQIFLTREEESDLGTKVKQNNDRIAARQLVLSHLRYVISITRNYMGYGLSQADLIQEGNIGLIKAVKRFDPFQGVRLVSFATHWIKAEIHEFILKNWGIVKVATTKAQRKLFFKLLSLTNQLRSKTGITRSSLTDQEANLIAKKLNVRLKDVRTMEKRLMTGRDESFEGDMLDTQEEYGAPMHYLSSYDENPENRFEQDSIVQYHSKRLRQALKQLNAREQAIIFARCLSDQKKTLKDLAQEYDISVERIRQIEKEAKKKLKRSLIDIREH